MSEFWFGCLIGAFVGANITAFVIVALRASSDADDQIERDIDADYRPPRGSAGLNTERKS